MWNFYNAIVRRYLTKDRAEIGMGICGIIALLTPLLLWVSWSINGLKMILATGFGAFLLATWFAQYTDRDRDMANPNDEQFPKPGELPLPDNQETKKRETWRDVT